MTLRREAGLVEYLAGRCRGKQVYSSKVHAKQAARGVRRRFGFKLRPYHCEWCGRWHLFSPK